MEQTEKQVTLKKLTASEGKWLTQADESTKLDDRYFTKEVYLCDGDTIDNWTEWDDDKKLEVDKQQKEMVEKAYAALH